MTPTTWSIIEPAFQVAHNRHYEGLMTIGSGPLQQRASLEEGLGDDPQDLAFLRLMGNVTVEPPRPGKSRVGTYLPGVTGPHPTCNDELINLPTLHGLMIYAAGERLDMENSRIRDYCRHLDLRTAHLHRQFTWCTRAAATLHIHFERFISAARPHLMALRCIIQHVSGPPAELRFLAPLDAEVRTNGFDHFTTVETTGEHEPITLAVHTNSGLVVGAAALLMTDRGLAWSVDEHPRWVGLQGAFTLNPGQTLRLDKFAVLTSTRHVSGSPVDVARRQVWDAAAVGFERLAAESDAVWQERWDNTDVAIEGDPEGQLALRVSLYHLLRAAVAGDARVAIDAKAAAGEAYCGRYFWDTEIFILPLFLYTRPALGQSLTRFRINSLDGARRNAHRNGYPGARYAWESSTTGDENCPNWQYADHEVHVTADVAYGLYHAHLANPTDLAFLRDMTEALTEIARYWQARVTFSPERAKYELLMVMGPDEYSPFCRNNAYTNRLAALALTAAVSAWRGFRNADPPAAAALAAQLRLRDAELARFADIAAQLPLPYDTVRELILQSDDFFALEPFDFERCWPDRSQRLGACVSQERLYRSRVLKQADAIQLIALFPQEFDAEQMRVAYETYEPLTSHDSSLSRAVHALVAAWIGRSDEALQMWHASTGLDLQPDEAAEGIHAACAGANWQAAVFGFAGLRSRMQSDVLFVDPHLPAAWSALQFPFVWDGQPLIIRIDHASIRVEHRGSKPIPALIRGQPHTLTPGPPQVFANRAATI